MPPCDTSATSGYNNIRVASVASGIVTQLAVVLLAVSVMLVFVVMLAIYEGMLALLVMGVALVCRFGTMPGRNTTPGRSAALGPATPADSPLGIPRPTLPRVPVSAPGPAAPSCHRASRPGGQPSHVQARSCTCVPVRTQGPAAPPWIRVIVAAPTARATQPAHGDAHRGGTPPRQAAPRAPALGPGRGQALPHTPDRPSVEVRHLRT